MTVLDAGRLNRATLQRQLLLERAPIGVVDAAARVVALQAQEPAAPYIALWNRVADLDLAEVDLAFTVTERALIKASLMRITLHAVAAADHPIFHAAVTPLLRAARLNDRRYRDTGLNIEDADGAIPALVDYLSAPRSKRDVAAHLTSTASDEPRLWWALKTYAPIAHAPTGGPWSFDRGTLYERADSARPARDEAVAALIRSYLAGFGPAGAADIAQFTLLPASTIRPSIDALRDELVVHHDAEGRELFDLPDTPDPPDGDHPAPPRLLGMWDSTLLAYRDRSRIIDDTIRPHVIRRNGDVMPTVLVDGHVAGIWHPVDNGIEIATFQDVTTPVWDELDHEARRLRSAIADRDPHIFARAEHWWAKLPTPTQQRTIGR